MTGGRRFRPDLYRGTAAHYDRFRPAYPAALVDDLRARVPLGPSARVLDLACGTGQVAFALAGRVGEVVAIDQEAESVGFAARKAQRLGVANVTWIAAAAEDVRLDGEFDLVAIANAFHRLDREAVARRLVPHLRPGRGCVALVWGDAPWRGDRDWQRVLEDTLDRWQDRLGARNRIPAGWRQAIERDPHERVLQRAGLVYKGRFDFPARQSWSVATLVGFTYSTSFLNRTVLGERAGEFERDLGARLLACRPAGVFEEDVTYAYELARRPG